MRLARLIPAEEPALVTRPAGTTHLLLAYLLFSEVTSLLPSIYSARETTSNASPTCHRAVALIRSRARVRAGSWTFDRASPATSSATRRGCSAACSSRRTSASDYAASQSGSTGRVFRGRNAFLIHCLRRHSGTARRRARTVRTFADCRFDGRDDKAPREHCVSR